MFITFEGPEGGGKTTQIARFAQALQARGDEVVTTRQPGGDSLGQKLRDIMLEQTEFEVEPRAELLMMMADRAQSVAKIIRPALDGGKTVLCDRYTDSSIAYQGYGRGIDAQTIAALNHIATGGLIPDLTFLLDVDPTVGLERQSRGNLMETLGVFFHKRVRKGYLTLASTEPQRIEIVDASQSIDAVERRIWEIYETRRRNLSRS